VADRTPPVRAEEIAEQIARRFHETYERLGPSFGWQTQESARDKDFDELPDSNRALMIATVTTLLEGGAIEPGPAVVENFREAGASSAD
jgi:hypothetical protein